MPARLHRESIAGDPPTRWLIVTHGIFGSGANWRSVARQLVQRRPDWGAVLVDLRGHGRSEDGDAPHDLPACAADLLAAVGACATEGKPVHALCGHSFGGKVALATRAAWSGSGSDLVQTWVLDATPSARPQAATDPDNTVVQVLALLERLPKRWARRADFVRAMSVTADGPSLATWLAMSLVPDGNELRLRLDVRMMRALLADYYARDLWPAIEDPALPGTVRLVVAARSTTVPPADRDRAAAAPGTTVDILDAGHWLHVDAPDAVVDLLARGLPR